MIASTRRQVEAIAFQTAVRSSSRLDGGFSWRDCPPFGGGKPLPPRLQPRAVARIALSKIRKVQPVFF